MPPRLIVAMPRAAAQVSWTVPAMYGLLAPLAAFSLAINMAVAFTVAHGMRLSGDGATRSAADRVGSDLFRVVQIPDGTTAPTH